MDQLLTEAAGEAEHLHQEHDVAVAVITPVGTYPDEDDYRRVRDTAVISEVLEQAAKKLKLTNTSDWVVSVHGREIDIHRTFREDHLSGIVEIEWHKREGGGGA